MNDGQSAPDASARPQTAPAKLEPAGSPPPSTLPPLTRIQAIALCDQVRAAQRGRWWRAAWWQCWGCIRFTGGTEDAFADKRCMASAPGYRGCTLINRFEAGAAPGA